MAATSRPDLIYARILSCTGSICHGWQRLVRAYTGVGARRHAVADGGDQGRAVGSGVWRALLLGVQLADRVPRELQFGDRAALGLDEVIEVRRECVGREVVDAIRRRVQHDRFERVRGGGVRLQQRLDHYPRRILDVGCLSGGTACRFVDRVPVNHYVTYVLMANE
ncbi:hypothetical protein VNG_1956H [Halobacterium salinarum NRC-1]|uniref:Spurious ORF n=1 Tax=Halobacterium salinarum (strain ATCC 700922 / JCM 11081 / NRC-1) TaxID=64091 RepID=Q9HNT3_HALSA|nr:hypothetical protein VNG_1956H [Halobacterium salinarum NRC-1]DAC78876.1 TPA_inf: spurious ORF [Halobacterium salinarum NRC-1]